VHNEDRLARPCRERRVRGHRGGRRQRAVEVEVQEPTRLEPGAYIRSLSAQLEDLREHIAHIRAQLEHLQDTSTGQIGFDEGQSQLKLSGNGHS